MSGARHRTGLRRTLGSVCVDVVAFAAQLLAPPFALAALQGALGLCDVGGELVLLGAELLLELGQGLLASLELVEPDLVVRLVPSLAPLEVLLAVVQLADALPKVGLGLAEALLALLDPLTRGRR